MQVTLSTDEELKTFAKANPIDTFALEFSPKFESAILDTEAHTPTVYELVAQRWRVLHLLRLSRTV